MRTILSILLTAVTVFAARAQCTPDYSIVNPGFHADSDSSFDRLTDVDFVIQFKNFDMVFNGTISVDSIRFEEILNLPAGLNWETGDPDRTYSKSENGCIRIFGNTTAPAGRYVDTVMFNAWVDGSPDPLYQPSSALGIYMYLVVNDPTGIQDVRLELVDLNIAPNPFTSGAHINFSSDKAANYKLKVYNTLGKCVRYDRVDVVEGVNHINIQREGLDAGMYFYRISDGTRSTSGNMIITD